MFINSPPETNKLDSSDHVVSITITDSSSSTYQTSLLIRLPRITFPCFVHENTAKEHWNVPSNSYYLGHSTKRIGLNLSDTSDAMRENAPIKTVPDSNHILPKTLHCRIVSHHCNGIVRGNDISTVQISWDRERLNLFYRDLWLFGIYKAYTIGQSHATLLRSAWPNDGIENSLIFSEKSVVLSDKAELY